MLHQLALVACGIYGIPANPGVVDLRLALSLGKLLPVTVATVVCPRFPRLVRVRDDKSPEDATTASQVADMYRQQAVVQAEAKAKAGDDAADDE